MGGNGGPIPFIVESVALFLVVVFTILIVQGVRKIPVQYAKKIVGNKQYGGVRQYIPLKVNASGVMPIIFAQAIMFVPMSVGQFFPDLQSPFLTSLSNYTSVAYNVVFRSEEHTSELQSLMRISYAVFCLKKKNNIHQTH